MRIFKVILSLIFAAVLAQNACAREGAAGEINRAGCVIISANEQGGTARCTAAANATSSATATAAQLVINQSALVLRSQSEFRTVLTRARVKSVANGLAELEWLGFDDLSQDALPAAVLAPEPGDLLLPNGLQNPAFLIAFSDAQYFAAARALQAAGVLLLPSELLAQELAEAKRVLPDAADIQKVCKRYAAGLVALAGEQLKIYDCFTFALLKNLGALEVFSDAAGDLAGDLAANSAANATEEKLPVTALSSPGGEHINFYSALHKPAENSREHFAQLFAAPLGTAAANKSDATTKFDAANKSDATTGAGKSAAVE